MSKPRSPLPLFALLSLAGLALMSCEQQLPTAATVVPAEGLGVVTEYFVTVADETPVDSTPVPTPPPAPEPPRDPLAPGWTPGSPPRPAPGAPIPTPPSTHQRVSIKIDPDPVPHSGTPITDVAACRRPEMKYTWYYDQLIHGETGVPVDLSERENFLDGVFTSRIGGSLLLNGNGTINLHTRWCSGNAKFHYAQTRFKGKDDYGQPVEISGPWVRLMAP
jgi:hypothetical protein